MKKLLLLISLLLATNAWAEEEFPIELTCEVGHVVINLHVAKDIRDSWWEHNAVSKEISEYESRNTRSLNHKNFRNKKNKIKFQEVTESKIIFGSGFNKKGVVVAEGGPRRGLYKNIGKAFTLIISRYGGNLKAYGERGKDSSGKCVEGFTEFKERKF